ncbi:MAG: uroporphyrinogen-III C-methyltransferase [Dokdonella sp.]
MDNDTEATTVLSADTAVNETPVPSPPAPHKRGGWLLALIVLALLLAAGWGVWQFSQRERAETASRDSALSQQMEEMLQRNQQRQRDIESLRTRLGELEGVNRSLREEVLGLGERSRNMEDAVANLAEDRLSSQDAMALAEAEYLLQLAAERLGLFHDVNGAISAFRLADSALAGAEDPLFVSVRQTIAAEVQLLNASEPLQTQAALASLAQLRTATQTLPEKISNRSDATPRDDTTSRFYRVFSQFVRITHDSSALQPQRDTGLVRSLILLDLRAAEAALLARDPSAFSAALSEARTQMTLTFEASTPELQAALTRLDQLQAAPLAPALPELGSALKELRNLRATRALATPSLAPASPTTDQSPPADAPPMDQPDPTPIEQPAPAADPAPSDTDENGIDAMESGQ